MGEIKQILGNEGFDVSLEDLADSEESRIRDDEIRTGKYENLGVLWCRPGVIGDSLLLSSTVAGYITIRPGGAFDYSGCLIYLSYPKSYHLSSYAVSGYFVCARHYTEESGDRAQQVTGKLYETRDCYWEESDAITSISTSPVGDAVSKLFYLSSSLPNYPDIVIGRINIVDSNGNVSFYLGTLVSRCDILDSVETFTSPYVPNCKFLTMSDYRDIIDTDYYVFSVSKDDNFRDVVWLDRFNSRPSLAEDIPSGCAVSYDFPTYSVEDVEDLLTLLPAVPIVNDAYFFGRDTRYATLSFYITVAGSGGYVVEWQYYNGSVWGALPSVSDGTSSFHTSGNVSVSWSVPSDWETTSVNGTTAYWVKAKITFLNLNSQTGAWGYCIRDIAGWTTGIRCESGRTIRREVYSNTINKLILKTNDGEVFDDTAYPVWIDTPTPQTGQFLGSTLRILPEVRQSVSPGVSLDKFLSCRGTSDVRSITNPLSTHPGDIGAAYRPVVEGKLFSESDFTTQDFMFCTGKVTMSEIQQFLIAGPSNLRNLDDPWDLGLFFTNRKGGGGEWGLKKSEGLDVGWQAQIVQSVVNVSDGRLHVTCLLWFESSSYILEWENGLCKLSRLYPPTTYHNVKARSIFYKKDATREFLWLGLDGPYYDWGDHEGVPPYDYVRLKRNSDGFWVLDDRPGYGFRSDNPDAGGRQNLMGCGQLCIPELSDPGSDPATCKFGWMLGAGKSVTAQHGVDYRHYNFSRIRWIGSEAPKGLHNIKREGDKEHYVVSPSHWVAAAVSLGTCRTGFTPKGLSMYMEGGDDDSQGLVLVDGVDTGLGTFNHLLFRKPATTWYVPPPGGGWNDATNWDDDPLNSKFGITPNSTDDTDLGIHAYGLDVSGTKALLVGYHSYAFGGVPGEEGHTVGGPNSLAYVWYTADWKNVSSTTWIREEVQGIAGVRFTCCQITDDYWLVVGRKEWEGPPMEKYSPIVVAKKTLPDGPWQVFIYGTLKEYKNDLLYGEGWNDDYTAGTCPTVPRPLTFGGILSGLEGGFLSGETSVIIDNLPFHDSSSYKMTSCVAVNEGQQKIRSITPLSGEQCEIETTGAGATPLVIHWSAIGF